MKKFKRVYCPCCGRVIQHYDNNCHGCWKNLNLFWIQQAIEYQQKLKDKPRKKLRKLRIKKLNKLNSL